MTLQVSLDSSTQRERKLSQLGIEHPVQLARLTRIVALRVDRLRYESVLLDQIDSHIVLTPVLRLRTGEQKLTGAGMERFTLHGELDRLLQEPIGLLEVVVEVQVTLLEDSRVSALRRRRRIWSVRQSAQTMTRLTELKLIIFDVVLASSENLDDIGGSEEPADSARSEYFGW